MSLIFVHITGLKKGIQFFLISLFFMGFAVSKQVSGQVGQPLESWIEGYLDIFLTNGMWEGRRENLADWFDDETAKRYDEEFMPQATADQGHIVIRVEPSGEQYHIYMLDDSDETFTVRSIHGPYESMK